MTRFVMCSVLTLLLVAVLAIPASAASLPISLTVANAGFELGVIPDSASAFPDDNGAVHNWPRFQFPPGGNTSTATTAEAHSGDWSMAQIGGNNSSSGGSTGVFQLLTTPVHAGQTYALDVWVKSGSFPVFYYEGDGPGDVNPDGGTIENVNIRFFWKDSGGTTLPGGEVWTNIGHLVNPNWQQFTVSYVAPAGAEKLQVGLYRRRVATSIYWDDVEVSTIPEPGTLSLVLLSAVGMLFKQR